MISTSSFLAFSAGVLTRTPLGELTALSQAL